MTLRSPLETHVLLNLGPVPITEPVLATWVLMAVMAAACWWITRRWNVRQPTAAQTLLEWVVDAVAQQVRETLPSGPPQVTTLVGSLFLFLLVANWSSLIPGIEPPTSNLETDAALALVVLVATVYLGVQQLGWRAYLRSFLQPSWLLAPLNILEMVTRSFSLMVRLFGNVLSGVFMIGVVLSLAGLFVPIPLMALEMLTGAVQAYIFAALALVFVSGAMNESPEDHKE